MSSALARGGIALDEIQKAMKRVPDKSYFRIGEVADLTGVKAYVLRYWETEFKSMIPPKSRSKQRMYRRKDIETILQIKHLLYKQRFTIEGARKRLAEVQRGGESPVDTTPAGRLSALRAELQEQESALADVLATDITPFNEAVDAAGASRAPGEHRLPQAQRLAAHRGQHAR